MTDNDSNRDYYACVNSYIKRFGDERDIDLAPLSDEGIAYVQRGSAVVSIHVLLDQGVLVLLSRIMPVPSQDREELFRTLLELSFLATGDAAFAIDGQSNEIYLRSLRQLEGLDYQEFEDLVHNTATIADEWDDKLRQQFGAIAEGAIAEQDSQATASSPRPDLKQARADDPSDHSSS